LDRRPRIVDKLAWHLVRVVHVDELEAVGRLLRVIPHQQGDLAIGPVLASFANHYAVWPCPAVTFDRYLYGQFTQVTAAIPGRDRHPPWPWIIADQVEFHRLGVSARRD